ncbi:MAG TPA: membrane or secreted protein [Cyclobacteriaceae bacterium]|nr:membrane or secreted protein [Cytophagales bacterium]HNT49593.1 membrane or secreted protein [Cyclobacteriaceae bacterium]HRE67396.1 membrane or secreted protein [Cyclobacteriaceae bacterium]HRF33419.1 membrane or secreted protein [Cyclobacteriaceae bacterium]
MKTLITFLLSGFSIISTAQPNITGAWQAGTDENQMVMIVADKFYSVAVYNKKDKNYIGTYGGVFRIKKNEFVFVNEFNTANKEDIGVEGRTTIQISGNTLKLGSGKIVWDFKRLDDGKPGALAGAWLITGRVTDNGMQTITPGARKTMKILSGSRFQWIAYNSETKEFFGTGGGTYTTENGKYTETIEVFSRDNSRVGAKLEFDFSFVDGNWRHSGKSSKGDPIDEIWTQRQKLGI